MSPRRTVAAGREAAVTAAVAVGEVNEDDGGMRLNDGGDD